MDYSSLIRKAIAAKKNSYSPYSRFRVGAALQATDGKIKTGCNVENSSYGLAICAERIAIFNAVSEGHKEFSALAIASDSEDFVPPCGACRQVIIELMPGIQIILANKEGKSRVMKASSLLPKPFTKKFLKA